MKAMFKLGKIALRAEVTEMGDLNGIAMEIADTEQSIEVNKDEIPELVKSVVANAQETRETIKVLRHEVTEFIKDLKQIMDGEPVPGGSVLTREVSNGKTEDLELKFD